MDNLPPGLNSFQQGFIELYTRGGALDDIPLEEWDELCPFLLFGVLGPQFLTGFALLDCHVLKGIWYIYIIGTLGR